MGFTRGRWRGAALATALGVMVTLAGCSATESDSAPSGGQAVAPEAPARDAAGDAAAPPVAEQGGAPGAGGPIAQAPLTKVDTRSLIRTGDVTVRVDNVDDAASRVQSQVETLGGFIGSDKRTINDTRSEAHLQLRVPADKFDALLTSIADLGREESRSTGTEDVTEAVVDLDARIASQQASVARTRALLAQARNLGEIVSIEAELAKREGELASLEARKRRLADLTSLSTLTAHLVGPDAALPLKEDEDPGFLGGLQQGWDAFVSAMVVLLTILGFLLPFALVIGLPVLALVWALRRARRNRPPAPAYAVAPTYGLPTPATVVPPPGAGTAARPTAPPPASASASD